MISLSNKIRWYLLAGAVCGVSLIAVMEFTDWHRLDAVTLDGVTVDDLARVLGLDSQASILEQPLTAVATRLLKNERIVSVDIGYGYPSSLRIETNKFTPVSLVLDRKSGRMLGLNNQGRIVPLRKDFKDWEHPVITGTRASKIFERCDDPRVLQLVPQLVQLADENLELYRLIDEIDLTSESYVMTTLSGLSYRLKTDADGFLDQLLGFVRFIERYDSEVATARTIDLRFANMIVQQSGGN